MPQLQDGKDVKSLQQKLKDLGLYKGNVDGIYGPKTALAVRAYQKAKGLTVDGDAGKQTLGALGLSLNIKTNTAQNTSNSSVSKPVSTPKKETKTANYYSKEDNIINYEGKRYTPYQFKTMVQNIENSPMVYTFGAPNEMLKILNDALYYNKKPRFKSRIQGRDGYGEKNAEGYYHSYGDKYSLGGTVEEQMDIFELMGLKKKVDSKPEYMVGGRVNNYVTDPSDVLTELQANKAQAMLEGETDFLGNAFGVLSQLAPAVMGAIGGKNGEGWGLINESITGKPYINTIKPGATVEKLALGGEVSSNAEVEGDEVGITPDGQFLDFKGPDHEQGGIDVNLPEGTEMFSKRIKLVKEKGGKKVKKSIADWMKEEKEYDKKIAKKYDSDETDQLMKNTHKRATETTRGNIEKYKSIQKAFQKAQEELNQPIGLPEEMEANQPQFALGGPIKPKPYLLNNEYEFDPLLLNLTKNAIQSDLNQNLIKSVNINNESEDGIVPILPAPAIRYGGRINKDGTKSTHRYASGEADGRYFAFPTLFQKDNNEYYEVEDPFLEAKKRGELIEFPTDKEAKAYAEGAWKKQYTPEGILKDKKRNLKSIYEYDNEEFALGGNIRPRPRPKLIPFLLNNENKFDPLQIEKLKTELNEDLNSTDMFSRVGNIEEIILPSIQYLRPRYIISTNSENQDGVVPIDFGENAPDNNYYPSKMNLSAGKTAKDMLGYYTKEEIADMGDTLSNSDDKTSKSSLLDLLKNAGSGLDFTLGDGLAIGGALKSAIDLKKNVLANRAGDKPNINPYLNYGKEALKTVEEMFNMQEIQKDDALHDAELSRNATINRNNNSARSINTLNALNLATDQQFNDANSKIYANNAAALQKIMGAKADLQRDIDANVMKGAAYKDMNDRRDRDAFYQNMNEVIKNNGYTAETIGSYLNQMKQAKVSMNLVNELGRHGMRVAKDGTIEMIPGWNEKKGDVKVEEKKDGTIEVEKGAKIRASTLDPSKFSILKDDQKIKIAQEVGYANVRLDAQGNVLGDTIDRAGNIKTEIVIPFTSINDDIKSLIPFKKRKK